MYNKEKMESSVRHNVETHCLLPSPFTSVRNSLCCDTSENTYVQYKEATSGTGFSLLLFFTFFLSVNLQGINTLRRLSNFLGRFVHF